MAVNSRAPAHSRGGSTAEIADICVSNGGERVFILAWQSDARTLRLYAILAVPRREKRAG